MRLIACSLTEKQVVAGTKDVTRRLGWRMLTAGDRLMFCRKIMGRKKGEPLVRIREIEVISVRREPLSAMIDNVEYGIRECEREGFKGHSTLSFPLLFVEWFCKSHTGCKLTTEITRIEFKIIGPVLLEPTTTPIWGAPFHDMPLGQPRDI